MAALVAGRAPLVVRPEAEVAEVAGFDVHRGVLAAADRLPLPGAADLVAAADLVVVVEGVTDHENVGALFRNAAAFGAGAVLLDPTTADPLYRRSVRVSLGHVLRVPWTRLTPWPGAVRDLAEQGFAVLALTPAADAEPIGPVADALGRAAAPGADGRRRVALVVGRRGLRPQRGGDGGAGPPCPDPPGPRRRLAQRRHCRRRGPPRGGRRSAGVERRPYIRAMTTVRPRAR